MKSSPKTVQIAEPLWRALEVMSEQMGVDKDSLVNQAVYALARMHGFITPPQIKVQDEAASVLDSIPDPMPSIKPGPPVPTPPEPAPTVPERDRGPLPSPPMVAVPAASPANTLPPPPQAAPKPDPSQGPSEAERAELRAKAIEQMKAIAAEVERVVAVQADTPIGASGDDEEEDSGEGDEEESEQSDEESGDSEAAEQPPAQEAANDDQPEAQQAAEESSSEDEEEPHTGESETPEPADSGAPEHAQQMKSDLEELGLGESPDEPSNLSPLPEEREQPEGIPTALVKPREALEQSKELGIEATALRAKVKTDDRAGIPTMGVHVNLPDRPDGAEEINVTGTVRRLGLKIAKESDPDEPEEPQERTQIVRKERPKLFITRAGEDPVEITSERYLIGRGPHCDLVIESNRVSREHAAVFNDDEDGFVVEDLGSSNGTWFKEERVQKHVIGDGDEVFFGNEAVRFSLQIPGAANKRGARRDGRVQA